MTIAHVQDLAVQATGSASSLQSTAFGTNPTTGNTILVFVVLWKGSVVSVTSVTDTAGNTYVADKVLPFSLSGVNRGSVEVWRASNITGGATFKVTVNASTTGVGIVFCAAEFSGLANASPLDGAGASATDNTSSATALATGAFTTTNANDLLIAHYGMDTGQSGGVTAPSSFSLIASFLTGAVGNEDLLASYYRIVSATQSGINPTATGTTGTRYGGIGLAYQASAGVTYSLFRAANLATGAGGSFFSNPLGG